MCVCECKCVREHVREKEKKLDAKKGKVFIYFLNNEMDDFKREKNCK